MKITFLTEHQVIQIHDELIEMSGGLPELAQNKSLAGVLHRIETAILYNHTTDLYILAATYAIAIAQGHAFNDGNKRTAMVCMVSFLYYNGIRLSVSNKKITKKIKSVAQNTTDTAQLTSWIKKYSVKLRGYRI